MQIIQKKLADIVPYANNTKKHDETQIKNVAESIKKYGWVQPIVIDNDGTIVIGHCRALAAERLGIEEVPCVVVSDLTEDEINALRIVDNKTNESPWDMDLLAKELPELDLSDFDFDWDFKEKDEDNPYTTAVNIPQYNIQGECPSFSEMYDNRKEKEMILDIENSDLSEEEKEFLIAAAHRHCRFNFTAIAEYYAHASPEMQKFMEDSALVIIDMDNAIMNGYVKLSKTIEELHNEE